MDLLEIIAANQSETKLLVVSNPHSRKNIDRPHRLKKLGKALGRFGKVVQTQSVDEILPVLSHYASGGIDFILSDSGDGGINYLINIAKPYYEKLGRRLPLIVPTNGGTIDFLSKYGRIQGDIFHIIEELKKVYTEKKSLPLVGVDSLILEGRQRLGREEKPFRRIGFAVAVAGIGSNVFRYYYEYKYRGATAIIQIIFKTMAAASINAIPRYLRPFPVPWERYMGIFEKIPARVMCDGDYCPAEEYSSIEAGAIPINLGGVLGLFGLAEQDGCINFQAVKVTPWEVGTLILPRLLVLGGREPEPLPEKSMLDRAGYWMSVWATDPNKLLHPVVDGELFSNLTEVHIHLYDKIYIPAIPPPR